jgi:hypothetical protein
MKEAFGKSNEISFGVRQLASCTIVLHTLKLFPASACLWTKFFNSVLRIIFISPNFFGKIDLVAHVVSLFIYLVELSHNKGKQSWYIANFVENSFL